MLYDICIHGIWPLLLSSVHMWFYHFFTCYAIISSHVKSHSITINSIWIPVEIHHFSRSFLKIWCKVRKPEARPAVHRFGPAQPIVCTSKLDSEWVPLQSRPYKPLMAMGWKNSCNWLVKNGNEVITQLKLYKTVTGYDGGGNPCWKALKNPVGKHRQKSEKRLVGKTYDYTRGHS